MNKEEFILSGLLELFALGISSPEETQKVKEALEQYPELKEELNDIEKALEHYAVANAVDPPESVRESVLNQIFPNAKHTSSPRDVVPIGEKRSGVPFYKLMTAAVLILLIGSLILTYNYYTKYQDVNEQLVAAQQKISNQENINQALSKDLNVVTNKNALPVVLKGTENAPDAVAKIFWMKNTGEVYIDPTNLPETPPGKQYQLWGIVDGQPVSGGMIETEDGIYRIQKMKSFGRAEAFAITLEKAGGSATPTLDQMVVIAKMQ